MHPRPWREHLAPGTALEIADLTAAGSLPATWAARWSAQPGAALLWDGTAAGDGWCRAGAFDDVTRALAGRLGRLGLAAGDRLLWSTTSSVAAAAVNVAALRAGIVVVPVNPLYTERELAHLVQDVGPAAAVVDDEGRAGLVSAASGGRVQVLDCELHVVHGRSGGDAHNDGAPVLDAARPGDPALIAYTSGTTGAPKGAVLSHGNLLANSESVARTWRWGEGDRLVHALPIFHGHGLCVALYTSLLVGSSVVLLPRFDPGAVLDACAEHDATLFFGVPTMYHRLVSSGRVGELARLRLAVSGSAPLAADLHEAVRRAGRVEVLERYGMTETLMTLSNPYDGERRPGTVGFPFPGVEARLLDGEIQVKGPAVFDGYWQRPAATAEAFTDGWFGTADLAEVDDGYVRILGRSSELVISGGYNVYPAEVEDVLLGHPSVLEVAVTGTPSDEWGEVVTAWVVPDGATPLDTAAVLAYAGERLAAYKRPRIVHVVDTLPRNAMGKVLRSALH
ncbi:MAG: AMP-binding protein [Acidimicrobiales bacterium]